MSVSDQRSQREVVEAAVVEAVARVLHDHSPMNGPATERWQDCPNGEIHGGVADKVASTMVVQALLDVVDAVGGAWQEASPAGHWDALDAAMARLREALAQLPSEVTNRTETT